jgi:hypothetical protein
MRAWARRHLYVGLVGAVCALALPDGALARRSDPIIPLPPIVQVICAPSAPVNLSVPCTVNAVSVSVPPIAPFGPMTVSAPGAVLSPPTCILIPSGGTLSSCAFTLTGTVPGPVPVIAQYLGDPFNLPNVGQTVVSVTPGPTRAMLTCTPGSIVVGQATRCTAQIFPVFIGPQALFPSGLTTFTSNGSGTFTPGNICALSLGLPSQCQVTYTPTATGTPTLTARYQGDVRFTPSQAPFPLKVNPAPANLQLTAVTASPVGRLAARSGAGCHIRVSLPSGGASVTVAEDRARSAAGPCDGARITLAGTVNPLADGGVVDVALSATVQGRRFSAREPATVASGRWQTTLRVPASLSDPRVSFRSAIGYDGSDSVTPASIDAGFILRVGDRR